MSQALAGCPLAANSKVGPSQGKGKGMGSRGCKQCLVLEWDSCEYALLEGPDGATERYG